MKLSEESKKFIEEHPSGKMSDLPKEMKDLFDNTVREFENLIKGEGHDP